MARLMLSHAVFLVRLAPNKRGKYTVLGEYTGGGNRIEVKCDACGHTWTPLASCLMQGRGCPVCFRERHAKAVRQAAVLRGENNERKKKIKEHEKKKSEEVCAVEILEENELAWSEVEDGIFDYWEEQ